MWRCVRARRGVPVTDNSVQPDVCLLLRVSLAPCRGPAGPLFTIVRLYGLLGHFLVGLCEGLAGCGRGDGQVHGDGSIAVRSVRYGNAAIFK